MSHNSFARLQVTNNFAYLADITIHHNYDNSPTETHVFSDVPPAMTSDPDMTVSFNTGLGHFGHDYWAATVVVKDGPLKGTYGSDHGAATMHSSDNGTVITFSVSATGLNANVSKNQIHLGWANHP